MFAVNVLYDEAVLYTNAEYETLSEIKMDLQSLIETPELYLLGRCRSNDEQLGYLKTSTECLKKFNIRLHAGYIRIADVMRCFHGDGPIMQYEAGNERGGH